MFHSLNDCQIGLWVGKFPARETYRKFLLIYLLPLDQADWIYSTKRMMMQSYGWNLQPGCSYVDARGGNCLNCAWINVQLISCRKSVSVEIAEWQNYRKHRVLSELNAPSSDVMLSVTRRVVERPNCDNCVWRPSSVRTRWGSFQSTLPQTL